MFTGIIEETGVVAQPGARMTIHCKSVLADAHLGASIAVNGTCLTAVELTPDSFTMDLSPETLALTNLGDLRPGDPVNLERPLKLGGRLDGHIVQGHVDGVAEVVALTELPNGNWWYQVRVPAHLERYMIHKGSVCLDGISLTIAQLDAGVLAVAIIPHTYAQTNLRARTPSHRVNVEVDMIAKYVEKLTVPHQAQ